MKDTEVFNVAMPFHFHLFTKDEPKKTTNSSHLLDIILAVSIVRYPQQ